MTSSIPPYTMPGPSSYYPPNYPPAGYAYMPMRGNGRGGGPSRGGGPFHPVHIPAYSHSHIPPGSPPSQYPKYNQNYSPVQGNFNPAWQQQPLSPLPKQLTMSQQYPQESAVSPQSVSESVSTEESTPASAPSSPQKGAWVIWSRRPQDPSLAPAIIFSPGSKPPPSVIANALDLPLPVQEEITVVDSTPDDSPPPSSQSNSTVPSSAVTETTDTPTVPGSPVSSNTSISAGTPAKAQGDEEASEEEPETQTTPVPPEPKKSWASLLKPTGSSSVSGASTSRLPTSSVVGFSVPASSSSPGDSSLTPAKKAALISLLTTPASGPPPKIRSRGLINTGNMCFANSVLQVLVYCPPFYHLFAELGKLLPRGKSTVPPTPLVNATIEFLREFVVVDGSEMSPKDGSKGKGKAKEASDGDEGENDEWDDSFIPTYVYDALKEKKRFDHMRGGHQEDAEEFFGFYLDTLEEELLSILSSLSPQPSQKASKPLEEKEEVASEDGWLEVGKRNRTMVTRTIKTTESPITRIFGGKFRSTLKAPQQKDSVIVEDWRSLRLDIQREQVHTVQDALSYISHPQPVQMTHPTRGTVEANQQVLVDALPPVLVLHMKRFCYDKDVGGVVKVSKQVSFGPELEIPMEIMAPSVRKSQVRYKLFGAIYHHGISASGGHYTLDVLHPTRFSVPNTPPTTAGPRPLPFREGWVRIDDELVSDLSGSDDVFNEKEADSNPSSRCAYLLFYRRIR